MIRQTNERYVYEVDSASDPGSSYRVDLVANGGRGECSCRDFETRRMPAIRRGAAIRSDEATCRHVRAVQEYFLVEMLKALSARERVGV